jgi:hypothetical protein
MNVPCESETKGMKEPNLFILGAPKCGTTSLAGWLAAHPAVYMSPIKEPAYFAADLKDARPDRKEYQALFSSAEDVHLAVGEASTCYLFSRVAVSNILKHFTKARFIVCLRNPIEMARSLHQQEVSELNEDARDFEEAWLLQETRCAGRNIPRTCTEPWLLRYKARCLLGEQVERLLRQTGRERVLFVLLEDLHIDPRRQYLRILEFLDLPDDGRVHFPVLNRGKETRSRLVKEGVIHLSRLRFAIGITQRFGIRPTLEKWNTREAPRKPIREETKRDLRNCFAEDILKLGALLNKDLTHWLA